MLEEEKNNNSEKILCFIVILFIVIGWMGKKIDYQLLIKNV